MNYFSMNDWPMLVLTVLFAILYIVYVKYRDKLVQKSEREEEKKD